MSRASPIAEGLCDDVELVRRPFHWSMETCQLLKICREAGSSCCTRPTSMLELQDTKILVQREELRPLHSRMGPLSANPFYQGISLDDSSILGGS